MLRRRLVVDGNKTIKDRVDGRVGHDAAQVIKGDVALSMYACTILHVVVQFNMLQ